MDICAITATAECTATVVLRLIDAGLPRHITPRCVLLFTRKDEDADLGYLASKIPPFTLVHRCPHTSFLAYYTNQCRHALHDRGRHILVRSHQNILDITSQFRHGATRKEIEHGQKQLFTSKSNIEGEIINNSIDLAARLYLMINIGDLRYAISSGTPLIWKDGSLSNYLSDYFKCPQILGDSNIRFEKLFNAYNMKRIAGIRVTPTNNLIDHLRMTDETTVEIFHHASFLKHVQNQLFPVGLLEETLRTLSLLFPPHDADTEKFFRVLDKKLIWDQHLTDCRPLRLSERQIETFTFWHDRLVILKEAFDTSRPATLSQWWHDRRNGVQWYTFWVAILVLFLTLFFGVVQSIEGALQVYKAYHPGD
jgi:hypothetical protein